MGSPRPRLVLADDHSRLRAAVRADLEDFGFEVCGEAGTADQAVALAEREQPDLCLLDVRMPGGGIEAAARIAALLPATKVVMLTVARDDEDVDSALEAGAAGYVLKDASPAELALALHTVLGGDVVRPRAR